jgi:hypothetical protein
VAVVIDESRRQALVDAVERHVGDEEDIVLALPVRLGASVTVSSPGPVAVTVDDELCAPVDMVEVSCRDGARASVIAPPGSPGGTVDARV